jgi:hypothetical protein
MEKLTGIFLFMGSGAMKLGGIKKTKDSMEIGFNGLIL